MHILAHFSMIFLASKLKLSVEMCDVGNFKEHHVYIFVYYCVHIGTRVLNARIFHTLYQKYKITKEYDNAPVTVYFGYRHGEKSRGER